MHAGVVENPRTLTVLTVFMYETEQPILQLSTFFAIALASDLDVTLQKPQPNLFSKKKTTIMTIKNKNEGKYYILIKYKQYVSTTYDHGGLIHN